MVSAQNKLGLDPAKWAYELSKKELTEVNSMGSLSLQLMETDSVKALHFLDAVERSANAKGYFFTAHFCMVKAKFLYDKCIMQDSTRSKQPGDVNRIADQMRKLFVTALDAAYHTEDDKTIGWVSFYSAKTMRKLGETSWAVMYSKNGVDLFEKIGYEVEPTVYTDLADLLLYVKEYDQCIRYAEKGIAGWAKVQDDNVFINTKTYKIRAYNIPGVAHYEKQQYDSAFYYYQNALTLAKRYNDTLWTAILLGNIGKLMFTQNRYDSAYALFVNDYKNSKQKGAYDNAANAAQWAARANLAMGNKIVALNEARDALKLLRFHPNDIYLRNTCYTLTQVHRALNNYDSAFYYNELYNKLNDSLEREAVINSLAISKARLNDEVSRYNIQKINKEKKEQFFIRNVLIAAIIGLFLIVLLIINRGWLKQKIAVEKAQREKKMMEQEMLSAKEQMNSFTSHIIEKTNLIEKLELQIASRQATEEQTTVIAELIQYTILTEDDWIKFRLLFEKIFPQFFQTLKQTVAEITVAEQRMAALIRLQLTTKQMSAMLGISIDSVHKTRQRLRQRLKLNSEINLEEYIASV
ncbi:tetratricopeptide repeat protein [Lacibacter luteus]|nr:tetratricopeptide repeat protein [Lacibacter luteus]